VRRTPPSGESSSYPVDAEMRSNGPAKGSDVIDLCTDFMGKGTNLCTWSTVSDDVIDLCSYLALPDGRTVDRADHILQEETEF